MPPLNRSARGLAALVSAALGLAAAGACGSGRGVGAPSAERPVLVLGGSTALGFPFPERDGWPRLLEDLLRLSGDSQLSVRIGAEPGLASGGILERLDGWLSEEPAAVILCAGNNEFLGLELGYAVEGGGQEAWPHFETLREREAGFRNNIEEIARRSADSGAVVIVCATPLNRAGWEPCLSDEGPDAAAAWHAAGLERLAAGDLPGSREALERGVDRDRFPLRPTGAIRAAERGLAARPGHHLLDLDAAFTAEGGSDPFGASLFVDPHHFSDAGNRVAAARAAQALESAGLVAKPAVPWDALVRRLPPLPGEDRIEGLRRTALHHAKLVVICPHGRGVERGLAAVQALREADGEDAGVLEAEALFARRSGDEERARRAVAEAFRRDPGRTRDALAQRWTGLSDLLPR
jgi:lysophospholipase L1-like esterase